MKVIGLGSPDDVRVRFDASEMEAAARRDTLDARDVGDDRLEQLTADAEIDARDLGMSWSPVGTPADAGRACGSHVSAAGGLTRGWS